MEHIQRNNLFMVWVLWQFEEMPRFLFEVWKNYLRFAANFFSAPLLIKTFFAPWKKYNWQYPKAFNLAEFFNTLISNFFSRILGAFLRFFLILAGILFQVLVFFAGGIVLLAWILMPFLIALGFLFLLFSI